MKLFLMSLGFIVLAVIYAALHRRFSPETLANGFMDQEKGEAIAPSVFKSNKPDSVTKSTKGRLPKA